jgi:hypothetical protein
MCICVYVSVFVANHVPAIAYSINVLKSTHCTTRRYDRTLETAQGTVYTRFKEIARKVHALTLLFTLALVLCAFGAFVALLLGLVWFCSFCYATHLCAVQQSTGE